MVGLGLPWVLYTSIGTNFEPYNGLRDEHILESIVILACVLAVFIVFMLFSGFVLYKWHGIVFLVLYVAYIVFAILEVYLNKE
jgi:Ca2+/Na+ antiporter